MKELGIPFRVVESAHIHEDYPAHLRGGEIAQYLAEHKSDAYGGPLGKHQVLLTADTIVWHQGRELGKPSGREEAMGMIAALSGDAHQVFTGVCLRAAWARKAFYVSTDVVFSRLERQEIAYYVDRYTPFDKAGAYGIQEWNGHIAVEHISGSYFNVMGLPVQKVYSELKAFTGIKKTSNRNE